MKQSCLNWTVVILLIASVHFAYPEVPDATKQPDILLLPLSSGPIGTREEWEEEDRPAILKRMQDVMGPLPQHDRKRSLNVKIEDEVDCGDYWQQLLTYESEPNSTVPAYLLIPKRVRNGNERAPGILCLHQTHAAGQKVVVGLGGSPNDEYAVELVKRGYVCIAPPYPLLADYEPDLKRLGYESGTMKAIWDNIRALDVLETLPYVRRGQFGSIGHSLGGHNGLYTAAFDDRIKIVVTSCGFDSFRDYKGGDIRGWTSDRYMPQLRNYSASNFPFDFHDVLAAIAPRSIFVNAPLNDSNFTWKSVDRVVQSALPAFELYGASTNIVVEHPDVGHLFPKEAREQAFKILEKVLPPIH